jgi:predicted RNA-binding protein YlqC (UPF0109 family)
MRTQALVELVELCARALVDHPEQVRVRDAGGGRGGRSSRPGGRGGDRLARIELQVAPDDIGKVIGKDGRTAQSLRTLLSAAASKLGVGRAYLDILD